MLPVARYITFFIILLNVITAHAGDQHAFRGTVSEDESGDPLIGATVYFPSLSTGTITDENGRFSIDLDCGDEPLQVIISYIGYQSDTLMRECNDKPVNVALVPGIAIKEVLVTDGSGHAKANFERTRTGYVELKMDQINRLPAFLGENDVLKAVQLMPGIQSAEGATTGFYVRGGNSDQNLIMLNDAVIYNPFHSAGFISIFNGDIVDDIGIYKTAFPSQYGGRLSSYLQVTTRDPSSRELSGSAGIGAITTRLTMDIPIVKDKLSLMVSGRAFYSYSLFRVFASDNIKEDLPVFYFYDAYGQLTWKPTIKDKISAYYYHGKDYVSFHDYSNNDSTAFRIEWSNSVTGMSWQHNFTDNLISKLSFYRTQYAFGFGLNSYWNEQNLTSLIREYGWKLNFSQSAGTHYLQYGAEGLMQFIRPEVVRVVTNNHNSNPATRVADIDQVYRPFTGTLYVNDDWKVHPRFGINYGVRIPFYVNYGAFYYSIDPKIVMRYQAGKSASLKASYSYGSQFVHMLVSSTATTPLDLWIGSSASVKPQKGHAVSLGYYQNFSKDRYEFSVEGYYRKLTNQIDYREGAEVFSSEAIEHKLLFGEGWTGGAEFFLRKQQGKFTGFIGYTLSWARRQFDELNDGKPFDYKYDRRHDLSVSLGYKFSEHWSVSTLFVIGSGQALTIPSRVYYTPQMQGQWGTTVVDYGDRNSYRLKPYHRLDLSITYSGKQRKRAQSHLKLDIYNIYNRKNSFFVLMDSDQNDQGGTELYLREYALIPIMPSISYQITF